MCTARVFIVNEWSKVSFQTIPDTSLQPSWASVTSMKRCKAKYPSLFLKVHEMAVIWTEKQNQCARVTPVWFCSFAFCWEIWPVSYMYLCLIFSRTRPVCRHWKAMPRTYPVLGFTRSFQLSWQDLKMVSLCRQMYKPLGMYDTVYACWKQMQ